MHTLSVYYPTYSRRVQKTNSKMFMLAVVVSLLAVFSAVSAQDQECDRTAFVVGLGLDCALGFQAANNTPTTEAGMEAFDTICTAECAGATAAYLAAPPCNNSVEAFGLGLWCYPADNARIPRCRYALDDLLNATIQSNLQTCVPFGGNPTMCPDGCAAALTALSAEIGCCFQLVYNLTADQIMEGMATGVITADEAQFLQLISTDALWGTCMVDIPADCTGNPFPVTATEPPTEPEATTEGAVHITATLFTIAISAGLSVLF